MKLEENDVYEYDCDSTYKVDPPPKYPGGYDITGAKDPGTQITFMFPTKPNWFHRMCCRFFLGWRWIDEQETEKQ